MKTAAVIAEFNPLHNGHVYFLNEVRHRSDCDFLICLMSGDFVQRGEPAILDKYERTKAALLAGCDLVLELPVRYASGSAPVFAGGAVSILNKLGAVDELWFGCESGDIRDLEELSAVLAEESSDLSALIKEFIREGNSYPKARALALNKMSGDKYDLFLKEANNILGLEYCIALKKLGSPIRPCCIKRAGQGYNDASDPGEMIFPSAKSIRKMIQDSAVSVPGSGSSDKSSSLPAPSLTSVKGIPPYVRRALEESPGCGLFPDDFSKILDYKILCENAESLTEYDDITPDLAKRIKALYRPGMSFTSQIESIKSKSTTYSHISRALLHILLNLKGNTPAFFDPSYIRILGMKDCSPLLHEIKKMHGGDNLLTSKPSALNGSDSSAPELSDNVSYADDLFASNLYEAVKCGRSGSDFIHEYSKKSPVKL